jgi:hypothetical protein
MHRELVRLGLGASMLVGLGLSGAQAAAIRLLPPEALGVGSGSTPAAMCGYRCEYGGRYIPGPPSVCQERGLNFCGPSRGWRGPDGERGPYGREDYGERGPDRREGYRERDPDRDERYGGGYGGRGPYENRYEGEGRRRPAPYEGGGRYRGGRGNPDEEE